MDKMKVAQLSIFDYPDWGYYPRFFCCKANARL